MSKILHINYHSENFKIQFVKKCFHRNKMQTIRNYYMVFNKKQKKHLYYSNLGDFFKIELKLNLT